MSSTGTVNMVQIRSVKQFFNDFIVKGLEGKTKVQEVDIIPIKDAILNAFKNEIFGQIIFKCGPEVMEMDVNELADMDAVHNILQQGFRKWRRLCILCTEHGLGKFFQLEDLKNILEEQKVVNIPPQEEDVTGQVPEGTVLVDENTLEPVGRVETGESA